MAGMDGSGDWVPPPPQPYLDESDDESIDSSTSDYDADDEGIESVMSMGSDSDDDYDPSAPRINGGWENTPLVQPVDLLHDLAETENQVPMIDQFYENMRITGYETFNDYIRMNKYQLAIQDEDPFNEEEAERKYMATKPTCFIILGLPINAHRNLAKRIANSWGCILLDAESVLNEELINDPYGVWGIWIRLTLNRGITISEEDVFALIYEKMHSPAARHVGYVMVGVPAILTAASDESERLRCGVHLDDVFQSEMQPDVIIYVQCHASDGRYMRERLATDVSSGVEIDLHLLSQCHQELKPFSLHSDSRQESYYDEWEEYEKERNKAVDAGLVNQRCCITLPQNWEERWEDHSWYYDNFVDPLVQHAMLSHDHRYVAKLDGRTSSFRMMEVLKAKLKTLPLVHPSPVILMSSQLEESGPSDLAEGEEPAGLFNENPADVGEDKGKLDLGDDPEEAFAILCESRKPGIRFRWRWSTWGKRCPVTSTQFSDVPGKVEFACRFMDKIYFLATEEACTKFMTNPRPYLRVDPEILPDKIFIAGPRMSGKTSISKYFTSTLGAKVFDMEEIAANHLESLSVKPSTFDTVLTLEYTDSLPEKEAILHCLHDIYSYHRDVLAFARDYHSAIEEMRSIVSGANSLSEIPIRDILTLRSYFLRFILTRPVIVLTTYWGSKERNFFIAENYKLTMSYSPVVNNYAPTESDIAAVLAKKLREYENEGVGKAVIPSKTWVVENARLGVQTWKYLYHVAMLPNRVIYLYDETGDYSNLMSKFAEGEMYRYLIAKKREDIERMAHELVLFDERRKKAREARAAAQAALEEAQRQAEEEAAEEAAELALYGEGSQKKMTASFLSYGLGSPFPVTPSETLLKEQVALQREAADFARISLIEQEVRNTSFSPSEEVYSNRHLWSASNMLHSLSLPRLGEYEEEWTKKNKEWLELQPFLIGKVKADTIAINGLNMPALLDIAKQHTNVALVPQARKKTPAEIAYEKKRESTIVAGMSAPEHMDEVERANVIRYMFFKLASLSHFGDTANFCPVHFRKGGALTPGKEEFACVYRNKTYWMVNSAAEKEFIANPSEFVGLPKAIDHMACTPRICVVGPMGSGKSLLAKVLAMKIKSNYYNFEEMLEKEYMGHLDYKIGRKYEEKLVREDPRLSTSDLDPRQGSFNSGSSRRFGSIGSVKSVKSKDLGEVFTNNNLMNETLRDYLVLGKRIPDAVLDKVVADPWFSEPNATEGFVMDGFPRCPSDIEYMQKRCLVPNLIIHLEGNEELAMHRLFWKYMDVWKERQDQLQQQSSNTLGSPINSLTDDIDSGSVGEREDGQNSNDTEEDKLDDGKPSRLDSRALAVWRVGENFKFWVAEDINFCNTLRAYAAAENIPWDSHPGEMQAFKLLSMAMYAANAHHCTEKITRLKEIALTKVITPNEAASLVQSGYYLLSKFGYWCPVQVYEQDSNFPAMKSRFKIGPIPVVYRKFVYYLDSPASLSKFEANPEKYVRKDAYLPILNIRIAVQGPPFSGKTDLCSNLATEFGLQIVSPGDSLRYVLMTMDWSYLANRLRQRLQKGSTVSPDLMIESMLAYAMSEKGVTGGIVLDGFPNTPKEAEMMELFDMKPAILFVIDETSEVILDRILETKIHRSYLGTEPTFSKDHMERRIEFWYDNFPETIEWFAERYQNVFYLTVPMSRWKLYDTCHRWIVFHIIRMYAYEISMKDFPHNLSTMCVTPQEFTRRTGPTAHYCIVCWTVKYQLVTEGFPPPARGIIQYKVYEGES